MVAYFAETIKIKNDDVPLPVLENNALAGAMKDLAQFNSFSTKLNEYKGKKSKKEEVNKYSSLGFSDGVKSFKVEDWSGVKGCYIKRNCIFIVIYAK